MNKEDIDELLTSISYSGMSPEKLAALKEKLNKKPSIAMAYEKAKWVEAAEKLFKEPRKNEST